MADNFEASPGVGGQTFASDDIGGVQYPRSKLGFGVDGAYSDVSESNPVPVALMGGVVHVTDTPFANGDSGVLMLAKRRDSDTTSVSSDGDYTTLNMDEFGRLKVSAAPAGQAATTGAITANGQSVTADVSRTSNLMVYVTGTFSAVNCAFEGSLDGTTWFAVQAIRTNANTIETTTGSLSAAPAYAWELSVNGMTGFRTRATAFTSGTQNWRFQPAPYATEPIPGAQVSATQPVSGSVTVSGNTTNIPSTGQGSSTHHHLISAATTNPTSVKTSAGVINCMTITNAAIAMRFFKLYNKASAPTVGTDTPIATIGVPPNDTKVIDCGPFGIRCATGIAYALTGGIAVADTTVIAVSDMAIHIDYT